MTDVRLETAGGSNGTPPPQSPGPAGGAAGQVSPQPATPAAPVAGTGQPATPNANLTLSAAGRDALYHREAQDGVSDHTHFPGGNSGVTLGPGYDLRDRTPQEVEGDLTAVGVNPDTARTLAQGAGLRSTEAQQFAQGHRNDITLTDQQQQDLFAHVLPSYEQDVRDNVHVPLSQSQYDAMASYDYNRGPGGFQRSEVLHLLNNQSDAVPSELNRANPPILQGRRAAEANQFQGQPFLAPPYRYGRPLGPNGAN